MNIREDIEDVLRDFLPDEKERLGLLNNILYYTRKQTHGAFIAGLLLGSIGIAILLKYFS